MSAVKRAKFSQDGEEGMEVEDDRNGGGEDFDRLPEGCVAHVLGFTSPRDVCRASLVSPVFLSAAASDTVWNAFLPSDHSDILSRAVDRVKFSSKRELFFRLCEPILIDGGKMSFFLERSSGKKCFMLSARALTITSGDNPGNCRYVNNPKSRFSEVAEVLRATRLQIRGMMNAGLLSRHTKYAAYIVYESKEPRRAYRLGWRRQETSVKLGAKESRNKICMNPMEDMTIRYPMLLDWCPYPILRLIDDGGLPMPHSPPQGDRLKLRMLCSPPRCGTNAGRMRNDGWLEMELGEFVNERGDDGDVEMSFKEFMDFHLRRNNKFIIEGIELRPKH